VTTPSEAVDALEAASRLTDHFIFIEVVVDKRDAAPGAGFFRAGFHKTHFTHLPGYEGVT
jgi:hypothetical protein